MRYPLPLALAVLALTTACAEAPTETTVVDRPSLAESPPPPPPVTGKGEVSFTSGTSEEFGVTAVCEEEPVFPPIVLDGSYVQNNTGNNAWIHFSPEPLFGSGLGIIHQTTKDVDEFGVPIVKKTNASGILKVFDINGVQQDIHILDYFGTSLFLTTGEFGNIFGTLDAEVTCGGEKISYTGAIDFGWGVPED